MLWLIFDSRLTWELYQTTKHGTIIGIILPHTILYGGEIKTLIRIHKLMIQWILHYEEF